MKFVAVQSIIALISAHSINGFSNNNIAFSRGHRIISASESKRIVAGAPQTASDTSLKMFGIEMVDTGLQATALSDMALALDVASFLTPEASMVAHLLAVVGRLLCITSDYLPDHTTMPDELSFQMTMLGMSVQLLAKSAVPLLDSAFVPSSMQDKRAYCALFREFGVSWSQYKSASAAFDWVDVKPNTEFDTKDDEYFYWLYDGDIEVGINGAVKQVRKRRGSWKKESSSGIDLLGNVKYGNPYETSKDAGTESAKLEQDKLQVGENGATLLRINSKKLSDQLSGDRKMNKSFRSLMVNSMQKRIQTLQEVKVVCGTQAA